MNKDKDNYDKETIDKAKVKVESFIRNNYQNIETVEFNDDDYTSGMGGLMIRGTVNGEAGFSASIDPKTFHVGSMGEKTGFPEVKPECEEEVCDY
ncbi:hypothetical protein F3157_17315 [Virgibacillus dakarensis]|uniref:hypothetical protein n=1 Tax=Virgibacillus dakarensis TaxID=1917889 RepID=UPI000B440B5B|nr:hypothetical protein [Virgibacillus dakarensis]MBT2217377.1 hypothetical protein [Virgibacillus dakarensis]MTW87395.1 hypothetical protein [Virgibacillus dakarensis]